MWIFISWRQSHLPLLSCPSVDRQNQWCLRMKLPATRRVYRITCTFLWHFDFSQYVSFSMRNRGGCSGKYWLGVRRKWVGSTEGDLRRDLKVQPDSQGNDTRVLRATWRQGSERGNETLLVDTEIEREFWTWLVMLSVISVLHCLGNFTPISFKCTPQFMFYFTWSKVFVSFFFLLHFTE